MAEERLTMSERLKLVKNTRNMVLEKVEEKIDFEEKWLKDIKMENGFISIADIEVAMSGIRSVISELKGDKNECS